MVCLVDLYNLSGFRDKYDKSQDQLGNMALNRYLFGAAFIASALLNVTSFGQKCVSDSFGTLDGRIVELQATTQESVVAVPQVCDVVGVAAEVCNEKDDLNVVVPNLTQVLLTSNQTVTVSLKVYCNDGTVSQQAQVYDPIQPYAAKILQEVVQVKDGASRAQEGINRANAGAAKVQADVYRAQLSVEKAKRGVAKAFFGGEKAQLDVLKADYSLSKAQRRIYKAQRRIHDAHKRANKAQHNVNKAQKRAEKAKQRLSHVQSIQY